MNTSKHALTVLARLAGQTDQQTALLENALQGRLSELAGTAAIVATETGGLLAAVLMRQLHEHGTTAIATELVEVLPAYSPTLRHVAEWAARRLLDVLPPGNEHTEERARLTNNLAMMLRALDRRDEAITLARKAVSHYELLTEQLEDEIPTDLAGSIDNVGILLAELSQWSEALVFSQRAVEMRRQFAIIDQDNHAPELARSLGNLAPILSALGRPAEAANASREAVEIYRSLFAANPRSYLGPLATALAQLGADLAEAEDNSEALLVIEEAVDLLEDLAAEWPDTFSVDLANALDSLSTRLAMRRRNDDALAASRRSVEILEGLAARHTGEFTSELANSLNGLGDLYGNLGMWSDAIQVTKRAIEILRAQDDPTTYPDLAMCLNNLGIWLAGADHHKEALATSREAQAIYAGLAAKHHGMYALDVAESTGNLALRLRESGRLEEALAAHETAAHQFEDLERTSSSATPGLAISLLNLGVALSELDRFDEAVCALDRSISQYKILADANPLYWIPELGNAFQALSRVHAHAGRYSDAVASANAALRAYQQAEAALPGDFVAEVTASQDLRDHLLDHCRDPQA